LGRKQSPLFADVQDERKGRRTVYSLFERYQRWQRESVPEYVDTCDIVLHIYRDIRANGYLGPRIE
jgi:hypothetical protein